jgi:hypothetical protein
MASTSACALAMALRSPLVRHCPPLEGQVLRRQVRPLLRADDFHGFFAARQTALLGRIEQVTGKRIDPGVPAEPEDEPAEYEVIEDYDDLEGDAEDQPASIAEQLGELPLGDKL